MEAKIQLKIKEICRETPDAVTLHFEPTKEALPYFSGQFLTLIACIDGREVRRAYSLSSSPYVEKHLSVTIKRVPGGKMSNYLIEQVRCGDTLEALAPAGNFFLKRSYIGRNLLLIGAGSGITPLFSMIKTVLTQEAHSQVALIYVNSSREETIFLEPLTHLAYQYSSRFKIRHYWSDERKGFWSKFFKNLHRLNPERLKEILREVGIMPETAFYLCGPQGLMKMASSTIAGLGFSKDKIHQELFFAPSTIKNDSTYNITIKLKGVEHVVKVKPGSSILNAGLEAGLDLPYSCQSGSCNTCAAKCTSGDVSMTGTEGLSEKQQREGYVMTCVGYPSSEEVCIEYY